MSVASFLNRFCTDTVVYWGIPVTELDGSKQFASPVEIKALWKEEIEMIRNTEGKEVVSNATVYVLQDLEDHGMLFHGELVDLTLAEKNDPKKREDAYEILLFIKTPALHLKTEFNRKAMISERASRV